MTARRQMPERFKGMMRRSKRDWRASAAAVAILRADSKVGQVIERALAQADLTLPQFNVLMELAASPEGQLPVYEVIGGLTSSPPNMTFLSNRMQERGLIKKRRAEDDSRVVLLELTRRGWTTIERAAPLVFTAEKELFAEFTGAELQTLARLLNRLLTS